MSTKGALGEYLHQIGKIELLSAQEEIELAEAISCGVEVLSRNSESQYEYLPTLTSGSQIEDIVGDLTARDADIVQQAYSARTNFINANLRLVVAHAKKYKGRTGSMDLIDVIQEGNRGLMRAVDRFDSSKGFKFSTYATHWIRQAIASSITNQSRVIRFPNHYAVKLINIQKVEKDLFNSTGSHPTSAEVAESVGLNEDTVDNIRVSTFRVTNLVSLDKVISHDSDTTLGEVLNDGSIDATADFIDSFGNEQALRGVLSALDGRERTIINMRYGFNEYYETHTLNEIGGTLGISRERVRQIETVALNKLREKMKETGVGADDLLREL